MEIELSDVLDVQPGFIIHGCNALGVMGSGVAKGVKTRYPEAYVAYKLASLELGKIIPVQVGFNMWIINGITQATTGPGLQVSYEAIRQVFKQTVAFANEVDPTNTIPIRFPLIGAGLGGGKWDVIEADINIIEAAAMPRSFILHKPTKIPSDC